ncbi:sensor histidine kinase [Cohnella sp. AR92]|uniref:cache domain-containing sensor histidine kinase n=1 Tax=Cohnella sp. AR92 TaxID=648716 RepID=UPI000F8EED51|nr:sensor histidine kinase [Cohnella sp. AR92]RUS46692.1 sensor histidine kinase [Cohnella sp. AR92]
MSRLKNLMGRFQIKHVNRQIFVLSIFVITIPLLVMAGVVYIFMMNTVRNEYQDSSSLILNNLSFNIDQYLQSIETGTLTAQLNSQLQKALDQWASNPDEGVDQTIQYRSVIENFVSTIEMTVKNTDSVQLYSGNRLFYSVNFNRADYNAGDFTKEGWYAQTLKGKGKIQLFGTHLPFHRVGAKDPVISIARVINRNGTRYPLGVLLVDIRLDSLKDILDLSENRNRKFLILDGSGSPIYSSEGKNRTGLPVNVLEPSSLGRILGRDSDSFYASIEGRPSYLNFVTSAYSGWKVVQYIEEGEMTKDAVLFRKVILSFAAGSVGAALLFQFILARRVTRPIINLSKQVRAVGLGKFDVDFNSERQDEFGILYRGIRNMVQDLQEHIERSSHTLAKQKLAQFGALKSQINPHFLANTLESIQMKAVLGGQRELSDMVGLLGRLFRIHIQSGKEIVPLREELIHTRLYVKIQQMRFGDKFRYAEQLTEGCDERPVLHFMLQPLIENAIVHGLERKSGQGHLSIATSLTADYFIIAIEDDGAGMDEENLRRLRSELRSMEDTLLSDHIGVKNVHDRIRYYYGEAYGLTIDSVLGQGTKVTIRLPSQ